MELLSIEISAALVWRERQVAGILGREPSHEAGRDEQFLATDLEFVDHVHLAQLDMLLESTYLEYVSKKWQTIDI